MYKLNKMCELAVLSFLFLMSQSSFALENSINGENQPNSISIKPLSGSLPKKVVVLPPPFENNEENVQQITQTSKQTYDQKSQISASENALKEQHPSDNLTIEEFEFD